MRIEANQVLLNNEYQGYGEMVEELTKERVMDEVKRKFWEVLEPYLDYKTEMTANGLKCTGKLNFNKEIQQYCVKTPNGYTMEPFEVLIIKPVLK